MFKAILSQYNALLLECTWFWSMV